MDSQLAFTFNINRCSGCMACVVACQDQQDENENNVAFRHVAGREQISEAGTRLFFMSLACMHCSDAPCLMACPTGALFRPNSTNIVDVHRDLCIGCHSCALACPFGAPKFAQDGRMAKCDLCHVRIEHGLQPACVRVCPTKALGIGSPNQIAEQKAGASAGRIMKSIM